MAIVAGIPPALRAWLRAKDMVEPSAKRRICVVTRQRLRVTAQTDEGAMPGNDSSACNSSLVAHAVPRRLRASLARIHSQPVQRTLHAQRTTLQHVEIRHRHRGPFVLKLPDESWFDVNMMQKDMMLALEMGRRLDVPLPTTAVTNEFLTAARGMGLAKYDFAVIFKVLAQMAGVQNP